VCEQSLQLGPRAHCSSHTNLLRRLLLPVTSCYCSFGKQYDKNGDYIRHFLPVLKVGLVLVLVLVLISGGARRQ
jgi:hypothetical protein